MKRLPRIRIMIGLLACGSAFVAGAADSSKNQTPVSWKITGELEEACSCRPACPCWFKSLPSRMTCDGVQAVFIQKGRYGKTSLDGLSVAQFVQSPEGKSMFESFGNWNFDNIYIDEKADENQRAALKEIAAHLFPPSAKSREFYYVPVTREVLGPEHKVTVGKSGSFSGHLITSAYSGSPRISNPPLADPTHRDFLQGEATKLVYNDTGQGWKYENSNYMFNRFKVDNKQYEEYEANVAKMMAQAGARK